MEELVQPLDCFAMPGCEFVYIAQLWLWIRIEVVIILPCRDGIGRTIFYQDIEKCRLATVWRPTQVELLLFETSLAQDIQFAPLYELACI